MNTGMWMITLIIDSRIIFNDIAILKKNKKIKRKKEKTWKIISRKPRIRSNKA